MDHFTNRPVPAFEQKQQAFQIRWLKQTSTCSVNLRQDWLGATDVVESLLTLSGRSAAW
jgi:hypothetical protein